jgi:hypothetical protein
MVLLMGVGCVSSAGQVTGTVETGVTSVLVMLMTLEANYLLALAGLGYLVVAAAVGLDTR